MSLWVAITCFPKHTVSMKQKGEMLFLHKTDKSSSKGDAIIERIIRDDDTQGRGETFFLQKQNPCVHRLETHYLTNFGRNMLGRGDIFLETLKHTSPEVSQTLRTRTIVKSCARKGGDVFSELPSHIPHRGLKTTRSTQNLGRHLLFSHNSIIAKHAYIKKHHEGCTQEAPRRMHTERHLEGCTQEAPRRMHT
jgi:hypothetical protein